MPVERHLGHAAFRNDAVNAHRIDAVLVKQIQRRPQNPFFGGKIGEFDCSCPKSRKLPGCGFVFTGTQNNYHT